MLLGVSLIEEPVHHLLDVGDAIGVLDLGKGLLVGSDFSFLVFLIRLKR